ncbi:MAG: hypothetical protein AAB066_04825 [Candidatus Margulisiibacteriota bacterium]
MFAIVEHKDEVRMSAVEIGTHVRTLNQAFGPAYAALRELGFLPTSAPADQGLKPIAGLEKALQSVTLVSGTDLSLKARHDVLKVLIGLATARTAQDLNQLVSNVHSFQPNQVAFFETLIPLIPKDRQFVAWALLAHTSLENTDFRTRVLGKLDAFAMDPSVGDELAQLASAGLEVGGRCPSDTRNFLHRLSRLFSGYVKAKSAELLKANGNDKTLATIHVLDHLLGAASTSLQKRILGLLLIEIMPTPNRGPSDDTLRKEVALKRPIIEQWSSLFSTEEFRRLMLGFDGYNHVDSDRLGGLTRVRSVMAMQRAPSQASLGSTPSIPSAPSADSVSPSPSRQTPNQGYQDALDTEVETAKLAITQVTRIVQTFGIGTDQFPEFKTLISHRPGIQSEAFSEWLAKFKQIQAQIQRTIDTPLETLGLLAETSRPALSEQVTVRLISVQEALSQKEHLYTLAELVTLSERKQALLAMQKALSTVTLSQPLSHVLETLATWTDLLDEKKDPPPSKTLCDFYAVTAENVKGFTELGAYQQKFRAAQALEDNTDQRHIVLTYLRTLISAMQSNKILNVDLMEFKVELESAGSALDGWNTIWTAITKKPDNAPLSLVRPAFYAFQKAAIGVASAHDIPPNLLELLAATQAEQEATDPWRPLLKWLKTANLISPFSTPDEVGQTGAS